MTIQWFPGHMGKALEQIQDLIKRVDVVIEVLDARLPNSSSNHRLAELRRTKPWIKILNRHDLADPIVTKAWVRELELQTGVRALPMSAKKHADTKPLIKLCQAMAPKRGKPGFPVRTMVVGIPNVGKSTLINTLAGKNMAKVGDRPAVTTTTQQIDLRNGIVLSDTPGVLWPDMSDQNGAYRLAVSGAIGDNAMDSVTVATFAGEYLLGRYPELLQTRYGLQAIPGSANDLIVAVGRRLGCLASGGEVDLNRASEALLRELRAGKIGRISFEEPTAETAQ
ncbi:ribosome biogenesis GTPase YlqF [Geobacter pelophilus]|uniref:Ribosome biogenesis GTPase A n=1 Tax=Geoanaerobacter pelophilus TaxID=60036 RepID=A0AAW4L3Y7_9BACT|nr:ribosome biogenesis GTPase YlqF [Geoanaerobacter pelophilus]MBT0665899.1 ribosome biogenesis GTPase YlqF [Geoanaerobacter pelophilus]